MSPADGSRPPEPGGCHRDFHRESDTPATAVTNRYFGDFDGTRQGFRDNCSRSLLGAGVDGGLVAPRCGWQLGRLGLGVPEPTGVGGAGNMEGLGPANPRRRRPLRHRPLRHRPRRRRPLRRRCAWPNPTAGAAGPTHLRVHADQHSCHEGHPDLHDRMADVDAADLRCRDAHTIYELGCYPVESTTSPGDLGPMT